MIFFKTYKIKHLMINNSSWHKGKQMNNKNQQKLIKYKCNNSNNLQNHHHNNYREGVFSVLWKAYSRRKTTVTLRWSFRQKGNPNGVQSKNGIFLKEWKRRRKRLPNSHQTWPLLTKPIKVSKVNRAIVSNPVGWMLCWCCPLGPDII